MLCPEVWKFDSLKYNVQNTLGSMSDPKSRPRMLEKIERSHFYQFITFIIPNAANVPKLIQDTVEDLSSYTLRKVPLVQLIDPVFIEGFVKRGRVSGISLKSEEDKISNCIAALTPDGILSLSLSKEAFQSVQLEGKPIQTFRNQFDKYICKIDLKDEALLKTTKYREIIQNALESEHIPLLDFHISWEPPDKNICSSSIAKFFTDHEIFVIEHKPTTKIRDELSMKIPTFNDLEEVDSILEYLSMLSLNCQLKPDEYLSTYDYLGEMMRVRGVQIISLKGFFSSSAVQRVFSAIMDYYQDVKEEIPWISLDCQSIDRTPFCDRFYEDFFNLISDRSFNFLINKEINYIDHQIITINKIF